jgi:hypothetical protein
VTRFSENPFGDRFPITVETGEVPQTFVVSTDGGYATVVHDTGEPVATLEFVASCEEGRGIGTTLTLVAMQEAAARGATELHADIIHESEMRIFDRLVGGQNLTFVHERPEGFYELPMTTGQAIASIALADALWEVHKLAGVEPPADFGPGVETWVDFTQPAVREQLGLPSLE